MQYSLEEISEILSTNLSGDIDRQVLTVSIDSRSIVSGSKTIFIALTGNIVDGHQYVQSAYDKGVRAFIVSSEIVLPSDASIIQVNNTLDALQALALYHRKECDMMLIGITGSNGKTIIKEWLSKLLSKHYRTIKSPKSYNSQIGVPLSVLLSEEDHEVGVFEAGISKPGEMSKLTDILDPTIGVFSIIGDAHDYSFDSREEKFNEKAILFNNSESVIYYGEDASLSNWIEGYYTKNQLRPYSYEVIDSHRVMYSFGEVSLPLEMPFMDDASIQNLLAAISVMHLLGIDVSNIQQDILSLDRVEMRMESKLGKWQSTLINDSYNSDLESLKNAIQHLVVNKSENPLIVLSDLEDNQEDTKLYSKVADILDMLKTYQLITIGKASKELSTIVQSHIIMHSDHIDNVYSKLTKSLIEGRTILLKGARKYRFENLFNRLSAQSHSAYLSTDISAIEHNLSVYAGMLPTETKIMAVLKASAYGSGASAIAKHLQHRQVSYIAVAYVDEGIELREAGVELPILIFNPDFDQSMDMVIFDLEPEIYDIEQLELLVESQINQISVHIKIDTGMHRLGILPSQIDQLCEILSTNRHIKVASVFSHLASSGDSSHTAFTKHQIADYHKAYDRISHILDYSPLRHIANTSAISNFAESHMDMVRIGLGLYGIDSNVEVAQQLEKAHSLYARILQIKTIAAGESVGYNRSKVLDQESKIAIINIGYADGLMRSNSDYNWSVMIDEQIAPIIGDVCMDLTIIDVTNLSEVYVGQKVEIFGKHNDVTMLALANNTIPYEILARISSRVKRVYVRF